MVKLNKILVIRFSSIGDIVLASPLIRALRTSYPDALIDFVTKAEYAELVKYNPHLSAVFELKSSRWEELRALRGKIRSERYELILDIHNSLRSRFVRLFSGAPSAALDKRIWKRFLLVHYKKNHYASRVPVAERYLEAAKPFGVNNDGKGLEVFIPDETLDATAAMMQRCKLERYEVVLGLCPAARHSTKRWLPERFVEFGVKFAKQHRAKILIFGGANDAEYCGDLAQMMNTTLGGAAAESFAGKLSLLETAAALDRCSLVVSNDTGIMHLAAARKKKIVALFGSTVGEFGFFPYGTESVVVEQTGLPCRPCSHIGLDACPEGHFRCMKDTAVGDVMKAAEGLIGWPSADARN